MKKQVVMIVAAFFIVAVLFVFVIIAAVMLFNHRNNPAVLRAQDDYIRSLELPDTVTQIAVRSAMGDSGGNGSHRTYRTVMLVKTELDRYELARVFDCLGFRINFHRFHHTLNRSFPEILIIREPDGYRFNSPRGFRLDFEELKNIDDFDGYFFIQFVS